MTKNTPKTEIEWPTLGLIFACYLLWALATTVLATWYLPLAIIVAILTITLHSSLQHEVIHGHPLRSKRLSELLVWPPIGLAIPYVRFRDTHLAHHKDANLTDPYDDPETGYLAPKDWARLSVPVQRVLNFNNTLLGRMTIGPLIAQYVFMRDELRMIRAGSSRVLFAWLSHAAGAGLVLFWLAFFGAMPWWAYALSAYCGLSVLKIRTFLEHRAHTHTPSRTVIVEDGGPLAFLFLNNNLHLVHHTHPAVPWYKLPALYRARASEYQKRNQGYCYRSYGQVFRSHLLRPKEPVAHPHYPE